jgi:hypothetical protein
MLPINNALVGAKQGSPFTLFTEQIASYQYRAREPPRRLIGNSIMPLTTR